jgi:hypothetical protein
MALVAVGCAQPHDLPTERCLEVLAYRNPEHGRVGEIRTAGISAGRTVTIHYAGANPSASKPLQSITCEYSAEEHWSAARVTIGERQLTERELALVNAELLLRDLSLRPQRFEERRAEPAPPEGDAPPLTPIGSAPPDPPNPR